MADGHYQVDMFQWMDEGQQALVAGSGSGSSPGQGEHVPANPGQSESQSHPHSNGQDVQDVNQMSNNHQNQTQFSIQQQGFEFGLQEMPKPFDYGGYDQRHVQPRPMLQSSFSYDSSLSNTYTYNQAIPPTIQTQFSSDQNLDQSTSGLSGLSGLSGPSGPSVPPVPSVLIGEIPKRKPSLHIDNYKTKSPTLQSNATPKITLPKKSTKPKHSSKLRQGSQNSDSSNYEAKKPRKPELFLPLDNLNNISNTNHITTGGDLGFGKFLPKFPDFSAFSDSSVATNYERMRILEPDLRFDNSNPIDTYNNNDNGEFEFYNFQDNVTPLMQPPGSDTNGYFGYKGGDGNSPFLADLSAPNQNQSQNSQMHSSAYLQVAESKSQYLHSESLPQLQQSDGQSMPTNTNQSDSRSGFVFQPYFDDIGVELMSFDDLPKESIHEGKLKVEGDEKSKSPEPSPGLFVTRPKFERSSLTNSVNSAPALDKAKKKRFPKGSICKVCGKYISRDMTRHMRIHDETGRFQCVYPKEMCNHKTGNFNRPYDYKKHLLHIHFEFDDPKGKTAHTLTDKLPMTGSCKACKQRYTASDWLEKHILSVEERCLFIPTFSSTSE